MTEPSKQAKDLARKVIGGTHADRIALHLRVSHGAELIDAALAEAWDAGHEAGQDNERAHSPRDLTLNPYRPTRELT